MWWTGPKNGLIVVVMGMVLTGIDGCAGEAPKPVSTITEGQVREHADKAFEKLKQEEKNRTTGSWVAPY
jgi:hypothetical protein